MADVRESIFIREIPKVIKFNVTGLKDVEDFFIKFESYCEAKCPEYKNHSVKELEDSLEGREPKYETLRDRIMSQMKMIEVGVKYKKTNDFEKARIGKNEEVGAYA